MSLEGTAALLPTIAEVGESPTAVGMLAALVLGLVSSVHCFLMCGPLACAAASKKCADARILPASAAYHLGRIGAYALVGGVLGAAGRGASRMLAVSIRPWVPWLLVIALLATALDLGKRLAPLPGIARALSAFGRLTAKLPDTLRAILIGAATPLLPCGVLYGLFAAAVASSSFVFGAAMLGLFAIGAAPALALAQAQTNWLRRLPGGAEIFVRRVLPLLAAGVVAFRAIAAARGGPRPCH